MVLRLQFLQYNGYPTLQTETTYCFTEEIGRVVVLTRMDSQDVLPPVQVLPPVNEVVNMPSLMPNICVVGHMVWSLFFLMWIGSPLNVPVTIITRSPIYAIINKIIHIFLVCMISQMSQFYQYTR